MVAAGTSLKLNEAIWPGCYYARSDSGHVARVEQRAFVRSLSKDAAGPTNGVNPLDLHDHLPPEMIHERELLVCRL